MRATACGLHTHPCAISIFLRPHHPGIIIRSLPARFVSQKHLRYKKGALRNHSQSAFAFMFYILPAIFSKVNGKFRFFMIL